MFWNVLSKKLCKEAALTVVIGRPQFDEDICVSITFSYIKYHNLDDGRTFNNIS